MLREMRAFGVVAAVATCIAFWAASGHSAKATPAAGCPPTLEPRSNTFESAGGPIDSALHLRARGRLRAVMIFVDFRDGQAKESPQASASLLAPGTTRWFAEASYGRVALSITPVNRWYRMPRLSTQYGYERGLTFATHKRYVSDAVRAADRAVDFGKYQIVYIVAAQSPGVTFSPTFHAYAGTGVPADGREVRWAVTLGNDIHAPNWGYRVPVHETGHLFGLPDLYDLGTPTYPDLLRFVGGWDVMSMNGTGAHFFAWNKWRLGWLARNQVLCLNASRKPRHRAQTAGNARRRQGRRGQDRRLDGDRRGSAQAHREDAALCDEGVLVYKVDATTRTGRGPIRIVSSSSGSDEEQIARCGLRYDAGLDEGAVYEDTSLKVEVLRSSPDRSYQVRVTRK